MDLKKRKHFTLKYEDRFLVSFVSLFIFTNKKDLAVDEL